MIREINPNSIEEINLIALRMGETLVEVLGSEKGKNYYSESWLLERVKWHLDKSKSTSKIFLKIEFNDSIVGHAIARIEKDEEEKQYGYFSTIYVAPNFRSRGYAIELMDKVEEWLIGLGLKRIIYNTSENHSRLIKAFNIRGYKITHHENEMVQLTKFV